MIIKAEEKDLDEIMHIVALIIKEMNSYNSHQWDEDYPQRKEFELDLQKDRLYVDKNEKGEIRGVAALVTEDDPEYLAPDVKWLRTSKPLILHRFVVSPEYRNQKVGVNFVNFAIELAKKEGIDHLKADTYYMNKNMQSFLLAMKFQRVEGAIHFRGPDTDFYGYEMLL